MSKKSKIEVVVTKEATAEETTPEEVSKNDKLTKSFIDTYTALKTDIGSRLKWYKNQDEEFYIIDRISTFFFFHAFRDSLFQYDPNTILCERLYFKDKCESSMVSIPKFTDEQKLFFDEFGKFSEHLPEAKNLSEDEQKKVTDKLENYQKQIQGIIPELEEKEMFSYLDSSTASTYNVTALKEADDESLDYVASIMANFVLSYFQTMSYTMNVSNLEVRGVQCEDYIDIMVIVK